MGQRRYIVAGPPCAGKSSFVRWAAIAGDLIWDYDLVHQALSGLDLHQHLDAIQPYVLDARRAVYDTLEAHGEQAAWIITATRKTAELEALRDRFQAEVVLLAISQEDAHARCMADRRPEAWHGYIDDWFRDTDIDAVQWPMPEIKSQKKGIMEKKTFRAPIELKGDGANGEFRSVFATFNVADHDGDVTVPGAFQEGQRVVVEGWNHDYGLPVGKAVIHADDSSAWVEGALFLDTTMGEELYKTLQQLDGLEEWSYTFRVLESDLEKREGSQVRVLKRLDVWGVAPVTRGAGIGTRTVTLKAASGLTDEEIARLKALVKDDDQNGATGADDDSGDGDEGQTGDRVPSERIRDLEMQIQILQVQTEV